MLAALGILNVVRLHAIEVVLLVQPVTLVALLEDVVVHQHGALLEHEENLGLQAVVEHSDEEALLPNNTTNNLNEHLVLQVRIEHLEHLILVQLLLFLVFQPLLQVTADLFPQGRRYLLLKQILVYVKYLLLKLILNSVGLPDDGLDGADDVGEHAAGN